MKQLGEAAGVELDSVLGEGRHSIVYLGEREGERYAVKWQKPVDGRVGEQTRRRFAREAGTLARLRHPSLPTVWSVGDCEGRPYLVMDFVAGQPLDRVFEQTELTASQVARIGIGLARGLEALHRAGLVHRDVKPANAVWDGERVRLVDFGLVGDPAPRFADGADEREDEIVGTLAYAAPEQLRVVKRPVDERSDLFGLGAVLYTACAGRAPYERADIEGLMRAHATEGAPSVAEHLPEEWAPLAEVIDRLLAKAPEDRFASATVVVRALSEAVRRSSGASVAESLDEPPGGEDLRRRLNLSGRRQEFRELCEQWRRFRRIEGGAMAVVKGGWRMGQSAILEELVDEIEGEASSMLRLGGSGEDPRPLSGVRRLLEDFLRTSPRGGVVERRLELLGSVLDQMSASAEVRRLIGDVVGSGEAGGGSTGGALSGRQFVGELARLLGRLAGRRAPALVVVDEVERLEATSRRVVRRLSQLLDQFDVMLVVAGSAGRGSGGELLEQLRDGIELYDGGAGGEGSEGSVRAIELELTPFDGEQVGEFVATYLGASVDDEAFVEQLRATTAGRPVALEQLLDSMIERGVVRPDWEGWIVDHERLGRLEMPDDAERVIVDRLERLADEVRAVCTVAAVWGGRFRRAPLAAVTGWGEQVLDELLEAAVREDLVVAEHGKGAARYRFVHRALRERLLEEAEVSTLRRCHQAYAEWLDEQGGWSFRMARHYAEGDCARPERCAEVCLRAARRAASEFAAEQTLVFTRAVEEAVERMGGTLPAIAEYLHGWALAQTERIDEAITHLERAIRLAETPAERARYQLTSTTIELSRMQFERVDGAMRRTFAWLDEPVPESATGRVASLVWFLCVVCWLELFGGCSASAAEERARLERASRAYDMLGTAAVFRDESLLALYAEFGRMATALRIGPSPQLVRAYGSSATVAALAERFERARRQLDRGWAVVETIDDPYAETRLELVETWVAHIEGDPVEAAEGAEAILRGRADQLPLFERSLAIEEVAVNYAMRGHSEKVLEWFRRWRVTQEGEGSEPVPSTMYSTGVYHARLCGEPALAEQLRSRSERGFEADGAPFFWRSHWGVVAMDEVAKRGEPEAVERALEKRLAYGDEPARETFWGKTFYIYAVYARRYLLDRAPAFERDERLEDYRRAVDRLQRAAGDHPSFRTHALAARGDLRYRRGEERLAEVTLGRADEQARAIDNHWVRYEVAKVRAERAAERGDEARSKSRAGEAVRHARRAGWSLPIRRLHERFDLTGGDRSGPRHSGGTGFGSGSDTPAHQIELSRKLDALLEVSMATSSIVDPEEVTRVVVDSAMRVLGAERGLLFLADSAPVRRLPEMQPAVVRVAGEEADESDAGASPTFSRTVLEQVVSRREAVVVRSTEEGERLGAESLVTSGVRSVIAAPLFFERELVGVIYLDNRLAEAVFEAGDVEVLEAIAHHIPVALETARSAQLQVEVATEKQRRADAERMRRFAEDVNGMLEVGEILARLLAEMRDVLFVERGWGLCPEGGELRIEARLREGNVEQVDPKAERAQRLTPGPLVQEVLDGQGLRVISEVGNEVRRSESLVDDADRAWLVAALASGDETVGAVTVGANRPEAFDETDVEQVRALCGQAGVAIEKTILATVDALTGAYNRRRFFELASREFSRARRHGTPLAALLVDLDEFKAVNDTHGHACGDEVLAEVAERLEGELRHSDLFGRYGGEEFAVVLPQTGLAEAARRVAERLRRGVAAEPIEAEEERIEMTVSLGAAALAPGDERIHDLLGRADEALYAAKEAGKDCVRAIEVPAASG